MSGSIARAIAQIAMFGFNVFIKAFSQAYQQAKSGAGPVSSAASTIGKMPLDQAKQVLQVEFKIGGAVPRDEVIKQFDKYYAGELTKRLAVVEKRRRKGRGGADAAH